MTIRRVLSAAQGKVRWRHPAHKYQAIAEALPTRRARLMQSSAEFIRTKPLASLGIGMRIAAGVPLAIVLLFASIIGAPLAMLLGAICLAITPVAVAAIAYLLGMVALKFITKADYPATA